MPNPILGFGLQPAGISAAGLGTPLGLPLPGHAYDTRTDLVAARRINLATKDYDVDADSENLSHEAMDAIEQRVVLALTTKRRRLPFDRNRGNDFLNARKAPADIQALARNSAEEALLEMTQAGEVRIDSVEALQEGGRAIEIVRWTNLATRQERVTATR